MPNKKEEEGKKRKINGLARSVRWSEELSFRDCIFELFFFFCKTTEFFFATPKCRSPISNEAT